MKTHLPVALRKALLAAIAAVSAFAYNHASAVDIVDITAANQNYTVTGDEKITVGVISETADNLTLKTESGNVTINEITTSQETSLDGLSIASGGTVGIGGSSGQLSGAEISAVRDITIGDEPPADLLKIGSETGSSTIDTKGNLIVKQSLDIQAVNGNNVKITSAGKMDFSGIAALTIGGDAVSEVLLQAGGPITMQYEYGTQIGKNVKLVTTDENNNVSIVTTDEGETNEVYGAIKSSGKVSMTGSSNKIQNESKEINSVCAKNGIEISATGRENVVYCSALSTESGGIMMSADAPKTFNYVSNANLSVTKSGNVEMQGGAVMVYDSSLATAAGAVKLEGKSASVTNSTVSGTEEVIIAGNVVDADGTGVLDVYVDGKTITIGDTATATTIGSQNESDDKFTTLEASDKIAVKGSSVTVSGETAIESTGGDVEIEASAGAAAVTGGSVAGAGEVKISGAGGSTVSDVDVDGKTINIGAGGTTLVEAGTTLDASDKIAVKGSSVTVSGETAIKSTGGDVEIEASTGVAAVTGGSVASAGEVKISGAGGTTVSDVDVDGKTITIGDAATATTIGSQNESDDKFTTLDATSAIDLKGQTVKVQDTIVKSETGSVTVSGTEGNGISDSKITAESGELALVGTNSANSISGSIVKVDVGVRMEGKSAKMSVSEVTATLGNVHLAGTESNVIADSTVKAQGGSVILAGGTTAQHTISGNATKVMAGADVYIDGKSNIIKDGATVQAKKGISLGAFGTADADVNLVDGATLSTTDDGNIKLTAECNNKVTNAAHLNAAQSVEVDGKINSITEDSEVLAGDSVAVVGDVRNIVSDSTVTASKGVVTLGNAKGSTDIVANTINNTSQVTAGLSVYMTGDSNRILGGASVQGGDHVSMTAGTMNIVANSSVVAKDGSIEMKGDSGVSNVVTSSTGDTTLTAAQAVQIVGKNIITSDTPDGSRTLIQSETGDVFIKGDNDIRYATLAAKGDEGDVYISTGTGDSMTRIEDSDISGETVTIEGDITERSTENLAVVTGGQTTIAARGEDEEAGIRLNNVSVKDAGSIDSEGSGNILILNRVDVENATLTIANAASSAGRIVVDAPDGRMADVLNMKAGSHLAGRLSGSGLINKSGGDALLLALDHTDFHGCIFANGATGSAVGGVVDDAAANAGSWIQMSGAGVGTGATFVLKNTDLVVTADGVAETQIGSLDTTQDSAAGNNAATGGTLLADALYTMDDNLRADFRTVGSVLEVNAGTSGDVLQAANLRLSDATLIKLDAEVDAAGQASSDRIVATGTIQAAATTGLNSTSTATAPSTARVYVNNLAAAAHAAEGARTTILEGHMATDINEDVLYDVTRAANGTYQRVLQERNVHLENKGERVELVFSKNYRSAAKTPMQQSVSDTLLQMSDAMDHSEGTLAAKGDFLSRVIDAFDYTRSEDAALRGLQSVVGADMTMAQYMMLDSSRHHINNLRRQITLPECCTTPQHIVPGGKGGLGAGARKSHVWGTYVGASDSLDGDAYMGDYSRSSHGFMLGYDTTVRRKLLMGLSFGYDSSKGSTDFARMDSDTFYADLYAAARTGRWNHRASAGVAFHDFSTQRDIRIDAGYHTLVARGKGKMDGLSVNLGYELSTDVALTSNSCLTPYLAANVAFHSLDSLRENELGNAGLESRFDDVLQVDVALGLRYSLQFAAVPKAEKATFVAGAAVHVDMTEERMTACNSFVGLPGSWQTKGMSNTPFYFELGLGLDVPLNNSWSATAGASLEQGGDRSDFSGNIGLRYTF
ncbi:MAG: autotransporter domain-containing protein [Akkermansia sp.]|nr:autotransporter domain-containing protein [Akkermansia sp.]